MILCHTYEDHHRWSGSWPLPVEASRVQSSSHTFRTHTIPETHTHTARQYMALLSRTLSASLASPRAASHLPQQLSRRSLAGASSVANPLKALKAGRHVPACVPKTAPSRPCKCPFSARVHKESHSCARVAPGKILKRHLTLGFERALFLPLLLLVLLLLMKLPFFGCSKTFLVSQVMSLFPFCRCTQGIPPQFSDLSEKQDSTVLSTVSFVQVYPGHPSPHPASGPWP